MKKQLIALAAGLALCLPSAATAQSPASGPMRVAGANTAVINSGGTNSADVPIQCNYEYGKTQSVYPSSYFTAAGLSGEISIKQMTITTNVVGSSQDITCDIYLKTVDYSTLPGTDYVALSDMTKVVDGASFHLTSGTAGDVTFDLTGNGYTFDTSKNLLVTIVKTDGAWQSGTNWVCSQPGSGYTLHSYSYGTDVYDKTSGTSNGYLAALKITYDGGSTGGGGTDPEPGTDPTPGGEAQTKTIVSGDLTSEELPYNNGYEWNKTQVIYPASYFTAAGISGTIDISELIYTWNTEPTMDRSYDFTIYLGTSNESYFADTEFIDLSSMTKVFEGSQSNKNTKFVLDTPYSFDSSKNLVVCFLKNTTSGNYDSGASFKAVYSDDRSGISNQSYSNNSPLTATSGNGFYRIPNLQITYTAGTGGGEDPQPPVASADLRASYIFTTASEPKVGDQVTYDIAVANDGTAMVYGGDYTVALENAETGATLATANGVDIEAGGLTTISFPAITFEAAGTYSLVGRINSYLVEASEDNNVTEPVSLTIAEAATPGPDTPGEVKTGVVKADNGYSQDYFPIYSNNNKYGMTQEIYLGSELKDAIGKDGKVNVTDLIYNITRTTGNTLPLKIYVGQTDREGYGTSSSDKLAFIPTSEMTLVYDGNYTLPSETGEMTIHLDTPVELSTQKNFVICVVKSEAQTGWITFAQGTRSNRTTDGKRMAYQNSTEWDGTATTGSTIGDLSSLSIKYTEVAEAAVIDLKATALDGVTDPTLGEDAVYTVTVENAGNRTVAAADYTVTLQNAAGTTLATAQGLEVEAYQSVSIAFPAVQFADVNPVELTARVNIDGDIDAENNVSPVLNVQPETAGIVIENTQTVCDGTKSYDIGTYNVGPYYNSDGQYASAMLYTSDMLGISGMPSVKISKLSFPFYGEYGMDFSNLKAKIYMKDVDETSLADTDAYGTYPVSTEGYTLVYDNTFGFSTETEVDGSIDWTLDRTFKHDTSKNLSIIVVKADEEKYGWGYSFYFFPTQEVDMLYYSEFSDPYNGTMYHTLKYLPVLNLTYTAKFDEEVTDMTAASIAGPAVVNADTPYTYTVGISNTGTQAVSGYTVEVVSLTDGAEPVVVGTAAEAPALAALASVQLPVEVTLNASGAYKLAARVTYSADSKAENNISAPMDVTCKMVKLNPVITGPATAELDQEATYTVTVTNNGTEAVPAYTVNFVNVEAGGLTTIAFRDSEEPIDAGASKEYTFPYTFTLGGDFNFAAQIVVPDIDPIMSETLAVNVPVGEVVDPKTLTFPEWQLNDYGDGGGSYQVLPGSLKSTSSQQIYPASYLDGLLRDANIVSIGYTLKPNSQERNLPTKVYLALVDQTKFDSSTPIAAEQFTLVYDGVLNVPVSEANQNATLTLQRPFHYEKGKSLAVMVDSYNPDYYSGSSDLWVAVNTVDDGMEYPMIVAGSSYDNSASVYDYASTKWQTPILTVVYDLDPIPAVVDLAASEITAPATEPVAGEKANFRVKVANLGTVTVEEFTVELYDVTDEANPALLGSKTVDDDPIAAEGTLTVSVPATFDAAGTYKVAAKVVAADDVNADNNTTAASVEVTVGEAPVLDMGVLSLTAPDGDVEENKPATFTVTVKNEGTLSVSSYIVEIYNMPVDADPSVLGTETITEDLAPGQTREVEFTLTFAQAGHYTLVAAVTTVDDDANYDNNVSADLSIEVKEDTGLTGILLEGVDQNVYGLDGRLVYRKATAKQIRDLAPGIYIIAGRKVLVK